MYTHKCLAGCGRTVTWSFAICSECEKTYGSSPHNWPEWLRFMWQDVQRERRRNKQAGRWEVQVDFTTYDPSPQRIGKVPRQLPEE